MEPNHQGEAVRFVVIKSTLDWIDVIRALLRWLYTVAVFGGCTYLVFWRNESGWLYLLAMLLMIFRRGL